MEKLEGFIERLTDFGLGLVFMTPPLLLSTKAYEIVSINKDYLEMLQNGKLNNLVELVYPLGCDLITAGLTLMPVYMAAKYFGQAISSDKV